MSNDCHRAELSRRLRRLLFWTGVFCSFFLTVPLILASDAPKEVLLLHSERSDWEVNIREDRAIRSALNEGWSGPLDIYSEYMGPWELLAKPNYDIALYDFLRHKYEGRHFDVIIGVADASLSFLRKHSSELFPNTPIVAWSGKEIIEAWGAGPPITGVIGKLDFKGTADLILLLHPDLQQLIVLSGSSPTDHSFEMLAREELLPYADRVTVTYMSDLRLEEIQNRVSNLPQHSAILLITISADGTTRKFLPDQVVAPLVKASNAPIYGIAASYLGKGIVGGSLLDQEAMGREAADLALRILRGERANDIPIKETKSIVAMVDWHQLRRWGIRESKLPPSTIVRFRELSLDRYRPYILLALLVLSLQMALILHLLAERRRRRIAQVQLSDRLRFEVLVSQITSEFTLPGYGVFEQSIQNCLRCTGDFFGLSAAIWQPENSELGIRRTHTLSGDGRANDYSFPLDAFPGTKRLLYRGESVLFCGEEQRRTMEDGESFRRAGIQSFLAIPLRVENRVVGSLVLKSPNQETQWQPEILSGLHTIADIVGSALARQAAAQALRESEVVKTLMLNYTQSNVAIIDDGGEIIEVNQRWREFAEQNGGAKSNLGVGANYLDACRKAHRGGDEGAKTVAGMESVLSGLEQTFEIEYACDSPSELRWYRMTVMSLAASRKGALIIHHDITQRKLAELEQQRMQEETARLHRATELGQLVASLAHELAQPMAAVLSNAQAARRLAACPNPDLVEIQSVLADIIEDDQRAGMVLNGVRDILKKRPLTPHRVNLNDIVERVSTMVRNNAQLRGVQLRSILSKDLIPVRGDEVHLMQVVLNLVNNAMDAMSQSPKERRVLTLTTGLEWKNRSGLLLVEDKGPGIPDGMKDQLFQAFASSKSDGLGMGLAICQSILQSLGGTIRLQESSSDGAIFRVDLPLAA